MAGNLLGSDCPPLLIVGASTRAAAWSAIRAGYRPICADLFADEDLRAVAEVLPVADYPRGLLEATRCVPASVPWMYTGAVENQPRLIASISACRPLWGNTSAVVRSVRDPCMLQRRWAAWETGKVRLPDVLPGDAPPPPDGAWMLKPRRGAAGQGIAVWNEAAAVRTALRSGYYFQRRVEGIPISSLCIAQNGEAAVLGHSRQWIGEPVCHAAPFQYCGSIGPIELPAEIDYDVRRLAANLSRSYQLRGLFGCDFLLSREIAWLTEINPRYTASAEVYEFARSELLIARHAPACGATGPMPENGVTSPATGCRLVGKAILYAAHDLVTPELPITIFNGALPQIADVPRAGSVLPGGMPICTVFVSGTTSAECDSALRSQAREWNARLGNESPTCEASSSRSRTSPLARP